MSGKPTTAQPFWSALRSASLSLDEMDADSGDDFEEDDSGGDFEEDVGGEE